MTEAPRSSPRRAAADAIPRASDTVLVRARDLTVRLGDADHITIVRGDYSFDAPPHALAILDAFAHPRPMSEVLAGAAAGREQWIELTHAIFQLVQGGALTPPGRTVGAPQGFARPSIHVVMLDDQARTSGFIRALQALTKKDDVVVDIGTGTGILATSAALAGAGRVYAIESSAIGDAAEKVFAANGVADRVTLTRGRSTAVTLPERASLLVAEIIGNDPFDEHLLEVVTDAKTRLLTPDARLIPSAIDILVVPVDMPDRVFERHVFSPARIAAWRASYGVDLSSLLSVRPAESQPIMVRTEEVVTWPRAAAPIPLLSIDLTQPFDLVFREQVSFTVEQDVKNLGVLLAFRATLAPGIVLTTLIDGVDPLNSWRYPLWPSIDRRAVGRGGTVTVDYEYDRGTSSVRLT